jgi:hypothetical protein
MKPAVVMSSGWAHACPPDDEIPPWAAYANVDDEAGDSTIK